MVQRHNHFSSPPRLVLADLRSRLSHHGSGLSVGTLLLAILSFVTLSGCLATSSAPILDTPTPPPATVTLTPTIVWFPPTATPTIIPTPVMTPTVDIRPQVGELIFQDQFTSPSGWNLAIANNSSVALGKNEISLAISQPKLYLYTLRKDKVFDNFYLEITASPNLCLGDDEYGVLFRVTPALDFYRLALTCNGQIHLDRVLQGKASSPIPKKFSGAVPPGAPSSSLIAIWASGKEILVYVNQEFQFSISDSSLQAGSIGLFARSAGENALSISFSNLMIYKVK